MNNIAYITIYLFTNVVHTLLSIVIFLMFVRAVLSWFPIKENPIEEFIYQVTEVFVYPVRMIIERFDSLSSLPIDISFFVAFMCMSIVLEILSVFKA